MMESDSFQVTPMSFPGIVWAFGMLLQLLGVDRHEEEKHPDSSGRLLS